MIASVKKKLADYVIEEIKRMLEDGRLREGDKLPNQTEFARQLGVSRLSLREALHTLQLMGVVRQKPKTGTVITFGATERWAKPIAPPMLDDAEAIFELLRARKVIESAIAAHAVRSATAGDIKMLDSLLRKSEKAFAANDLKTYAELDARFHIALMSIPKNQYLINMYLTVYNRMVQYMTEVFSAVPPMWDAAVKSHREIYDAVAAGDVPGTVDAVEREHDADITFFASFYQRKNQ